MTPTPVIERQFELPGIGLNPPSQAPHTRAPRLGVLPIGYELFDR
jgi:hypothetical protein